MLSELEGMPIMVVIELVVKLWMMMVMWHIVMLVVRWNIRHVGELFLLSSSCESIAIPL